MLVRGVSVAGLARVICEWALYWRRGAGICLLFASLWKRARRQKNVDANKRNRHKEQFPEKHLLHLET